MLHLHQTLRVVVGKCLHACCIIDFNVSSICSYTWNVPLTFSSHDSPEWNTETRMWLDRGNGELGAFLVGIPMNLPIPESSPSATNWIIAFAVAVTITEDIPEDTNQWLMANVLHHGYYYVDYDDENRAALVQQLIDDHQVGIASITLGVVFVAARCIVVSAIFMGNYIEHLKKR